MKLPQGPSTPKLFELMQMGSDAYGYLDKRASQYGDCFRIGDRNNPTVFFSHPKAIEAIFTADNVRFYEEKPNIEVRNFFEFLLGEIAFKDTSAANLKRSRQLLRTVFTGSLLKSASMGNCMQRYGQMICDVTDDVIAPWQPGQPFYVQSSMKTITIEFMARVLFGLTEGERYERLKASVIPLMESFKAPFYLSSVLFGFLKKDWGKYSPWTKLRQARDRTHEIILEEINERRIRGDFSGVDALSRFMAYRDENGKALTDEELLMFSIIALFNGYETTSSAMTWTLYWIHREPQVYQKIQDEIDALGDNPDPVAIFRSPYLNAVCKEVRRMCPVVVNPNGRILKLPMEIMGYEFAPGTQLIPCIYLTHMREDLYPQPKQFRPERFLDRKYSKYEYFPFGGGHALCSGFALAEAQIKLVIATLLCRWQMTLVDDSPVKTEQVGAFEVLPHRSLQMVALQPKNQKAFLTV
ncbi:cytochrome P450 [Roseofilum casamattae]|uniref:Cytochrome P450 n=1 Tax=Roseofilum casamattae BLCC-M143 TaxID=3022442 RepID=A0ABT7BYK0_9CYAN|nr:cytochrome P450 [Roseofilum casamattae]MDJ1184231.1 cytochrome P450 [Roseofilum casamattae BLCC-M143]